MVKGKRQPKEKLTLEDVRKKSTKKVPEKKDAPPGNTEEKAGSRAELMTQAQAKGIKNFRILNKEELTAVLYESATPETIKSITSAAKARWKAGWGARKKQANVPAGLPESEQA